MMAWLEWSILSLLLGFAAGWWLSYAHRVLWLRAEERAHVMIKAFAWEEQQRREKEIEASPFVEDAPA